MKGKEVQLEVIFHHKIETTLFNYLSSANEMPQVNDSKDSSAIENNNSVQLYDCLKAFKQQETLDEDNMWYCNKCKEFVQATKTLELFKLPRIMIISLKRFK